VNRRQPSAGHRIPPFFYVTHSTQQTGTNANTLSLLRALDNHDSSRQGLTLAHISVRSVGLGAGFGFGALDELGTSIPVSGLRPEKVVE